MGLQRDPSSSFQLLNRLGLVAGMLLAGSAAVLADVLADGVYLVTAKPTKATRIRENSGTDSSGKFVLKPDTYKVRFELIKVIDGQAEKFPRKFSLELDLSDSHYVMNSEINALVKLTGDSIELLHWGIVSKLACVPESLVPENTSRRYLPSPYVDGEGMKCVRVN